MLADNSADSCAIPLSRQLECGEATQRASVTAREVHMRIKAKLVAIALGAALMFLGATAARADNWDRGCDARIRKEQRDLQRDINRYGYYSRQAQRERAELRRAQENCRSHWYRRDGDRDRDGYRDRD